MGNVRLYGATSGYTELAPPAVAPDGVLTLPAVAGTLATTADVAAAGKILQVVQATTTTDVTITTTTYTDTTLTATITPTSASSKILVMVNQNWKFSIPSNYTALGYKILRDATAIFTTPSLNEFGLIQANGATTVAVANYTTVNYLDSPNTTSAVVYKTQSACANPGSLRMQHIGATSVIILMEVAA